MSRGHRRQDILFLPMEGKLDQHHAGELRRETAEAKGGRIVAEESQRLGWSERELMLRRKNDPDKMGIAVRLRREMFSICLKRERFGGIIPL